MYDQSTHKIIFRLSALGDVVLTTGVLEYWANKFGFTFTVITKSGNASVLENNPHIKEIIELDKLDLNDLAWYKKSGVIARKYAGFELIDLHSTLRSMILANRWKGKVSRYKKYSMERRLFKLTRSDKLQAALSSRKVTQRYTSALEKNPPEAAELLPRIYLTDDEKNLADSLVEEHNLGENFIAIHPYATHPDKAWPREHWLKLITLLNEREIKWAIIGKDKNIFEGNGQECNFSNQLQLRETCALLSKAKLLITGDSGPMHLSAGVNSPVIAMFGPTSEAWGFYPAGPQDIVLETKMNCRPCSLHGKSNCKKNRECLRKITPEKVLERILART